MEAIRKNAMYAAYSVLSETSFQAYLYVSAHLLAIHLGVYQ